MNSSNRFDNTKANQQATVLRLNPEQLRINLLNLFDNHALHPTKSTNEERVAYLENQRLKAAVSRVLDEV